MRGNQLLAAPVAQAESPLEDGLDLADLKGQETHPPRCARDYMSRMSGPILDRFDILLDVLDLRPSELLLEQLSESTADVRMRILSSHKFAAARKAHQPERLNAHREAKSLNEEPKNNEEIRTLYSEALERQILSARGFHKSIRVARTIADLAASQHIIRYHVSEALSYRRLFFIWRR